MSVSDNDAEQPTPEEKAREMARVDGDLALARRMISAYARDDAQALNAMKIEVHKSGRAQQVLMAAVIQATDIGQMLYGPAFQTWIDHAAMSQMDVAEQDQRDLDRE